MKVYEYDGKPKLSRSFLDFVNFSPSVLLGEMYG